MTKVDEIKEAIESLPSREYARLRRWFADRDWAEWDKEIEKNSVSGKLDFLIRDALEDKEKGRLKDL